MGAQTPSSTPSDAERTLDGILAEFGMQTREYDLETWHDDGAHRTWQVRLIVPRDRDAMTKLVSGTDWLERGDFETLAAHHRRMPLHPFTQLRRRRSRRVLRSGTLPRDPYFRELCETAGVVAPPVDALARLLRGTRKPFEQLLAEARHRHELEKLPLDDEEAQAVRDEFVDQVHRFRALLLQAMSGQVTSERQAAQDWLSGRPLECPEPTPEEGVILERAVRDFLLDSTREARSVGATLQPFGDRAAVLVEQAEQFHARRPRVPLRRLYDWAEVTVILVDSAEAVAGCAPKPWREMADWIGGIARWGSIYEKADALAWVAFHLRDRLSPLVESVLTEADTALAYFADRACRRLYGRIRTLLTPAERRLFLHTYLQRLPRFGARGVSYPWAGQTLWLEPVLHGLLDDERTLALYVLVVGFKFLGDEEGELSAELEQRVKAYLAFYPFWLEVTRERQREVRRDRRRRSNRRIDFDKLLTFKTYEMESERTEARRLSAAEYLEWMGQLGIEDRRGIAKMRWEEGRTQSEIAEKTGISQQAVSKYLKGVMRDVSRRMLEEGHVGHKIELPSREWGPRLHRPRRSRPTRRRWAARSLAR